MNLIIDGKEYDLSQECCSQLLEILGIAIAKAQLPDTLKQALLSLRSFSTEDLEKLLETIKTLGLSSYQSMPLVKKLALMALCRGMLAKMEVRFNNPEISAILRPPKRKDPIEHLADIVYEVGKTLVPEVSNALNNAAICITTQDNTIAAIEITESENRSTLATYG